MPSVIIILSELLHFHQLFVLFQPNNNSSNSVVSLIYVIIIVLCTEDTQVHQIQLVGCVDG